MRVRIVRSLGGVVEGLPLSSLIPGFVYDLDDEVAWQLIEMRGAVVSSKADSPTIGSLDDADTAWLSGGVHVAELDTAHDRPSRVKRRR